MTWPAGRPTSTTSTRTTASSTTTPVHVPISLVVSERNQVAPDGDLWLSVLESTGQPLKMGVD